MYGELFEPGGDTARFFEPAHTALDYVATSVHGAVELKGSTTSCAPVLWPFLLRNNCAYSVLSQPATHRSDIVALVTGDHLRPPSRTTTPSLRLRDFDSTQYRCGVLGLLCLARTQLDRQGQASTVSYQMQLGREPAATATESVILWLAQPSMHTLIFSPRPLHACVPGRLTHRCTRASTRSLRDHRDLAATRGVFGPTARSESIVGTGCTRSATARISRANLATARRCASSRASRSGWSGDRDSTGLASRTRAIVLQEAPILHPSARDGALQATLSGSTANDRANAADCAPSLIKHSLVQ